MSIATPQSKRNDLILADKVKAIQMLDGFPKTSQPEAAETFGCSQAQVSRAYKNREAIFQQWGCNRNPDGKRKLEGKNAEALPVFIDNHTDGDNRQETEEDKDDTVSSRTVTPTLSRLQDSFDVIRKWMKINDFHDCQEAPCVNTKATDKGTGAMLTETLSALGALNLWMEARGM
ncbi:Hypp4360 [Branchiostoma lanceolatum]|uniref:Hypp4360 protein n=1 Tax=Branchiostoma lanceolatum TaxID=7740 RepID=A0A8K0EXX1_BRALA|nr:Hypp4360 [Branchiostoma lanceolatum]